MNGLEWLLYSFDLGAWHFVVWPDPLRTDFFETHPHYFDWLEEDLEKNKNKPTLFFQHVPSHPVGFDPLINYAESVAVKRLLFDILAKHGNVKFIFSGHVHIPIKAYFKTVTEEVYPYPEQLPVFNEAAYPMWLNYKWQLEATPEIKNGDFAQGLSFWHPRYVYSEDENPSNWMEIKKFKDYQALYLYSEKRKYQIPGQDRLPQTTDISPLLIK